MNGNFGLRWIAMSTRHLSEALNKDGFAVSHITVSALLKDLGISLQRNSKTKDQTLDSVDFKISTIYCAWQKFFNSAV
jgi:transposase